MTRLHAGDRELRAGFEVFTAALQDSANLIWRNVQPRPDGFPPGDSHVFIIINACSGSSLLLITITILPCIFLVGPAGDAAVGLLNNPIAFLQDATATYGDTVGLVLGGQYVVLVTDPAVVKDVLIERASIFVKVPAEALSVCGRSGEHAANVIAFPWTTHCKADGAKNLTGE